MAEGWRMWAISLLTILLLLPLLSAAPLDIGGGVEDDNDGMHSHDENVTRRGKFFGQNRFDVGNIYVPGIVAGDDVSIGHQVDIDVHGHTHDRYHHEDNSVIECKEGLREMFKSIDSNKDGLMDVKELLRVCHQNNIQITESIAVRILTLPDKTMGFNTAKFCELLKDCPSKNSAGLIHFLLQLFDKGSCSGTESDEACCSSTSPCKENEGDCDTDDDCVGSLVCGKDNCRSINPLAYHLADCCIQPVKEKYEISATRPQPKVTCPYKDDLSSVLLENNWKTQNQINLMSYEDKRNTVIVEVEQMTGHTITDLQGRDNVRDLGSLISIANMATLLIKYSIRSSSEVKTMTYEPHLRNTLIVEASQRFSIQVSELQSMTDPQLLKTFCTDTIEEQHESSPWPQPKANLKLIGGSEPREGNIFYKGKPVCDDTFQTGTYGAKNGEVVCRELGFSGLERFTTRSHFGSVSADFSMDEVKCTGSESRLEDCPHTTNEDCTAGEGAGVVCKGTTTSTTTTTTTTIPVITECGIENPGPGFEISGGSGTLPNQYPWMVHLPMGCGGSLITGIHILTARHCLQVSGNWIGKKVKVGVHNRYEPDDYKEVSIKNYVWPDINNHDIAIVILDTPVDLNNKKIGTVCLPSSAKKDYRGQRGTAMGWGMTHQGAGPGSPFLQHVGLTVSQKEETNYLYTEVSVVNGVPQDPCAGDSGGPLIHRDVESGRWTIIGTVLGNGYDCSSGTFKGEGQFGKGKWNKVTDHLVWIHSVIGN